MRMWVCLALLGMAALVAVPQACAQEFDYDDFLDIVSGTVTALDTAGNKLTIKDVDGVSQEFVLDVNLTTVWDDATDEEKDIADLAAGKEVIVEFRVDESGKKIASWIDILMPEEALMELSETVE